MRIAYNPVMDVPRANLVDSDMEMAGVQGFAKISEETRYLSAMWAGAPWGFPVPPAVGAAVAAGCYRIPLDWIVPYHGPFRLHDL